MPLASPVGTRLPMSALDAIRQALRDNDDGRYAALANDDAAVERLRKLVELCPVYADFLRAQPWVWSWLEEPRNADEDFRYAAFQGTWEEVFAPRDAGAGQQQTDAALRRFRRAHSLRIAWRELNGRADLATQLRELTLLAEFVLRFVYTDTWRQLTARHGTPVDPDSGNPIPLAVLALGKFGSEELNFISDLDLVFFAAGRGECQGGKGRALASDEFFARFVRTLAGRLQERSNDGFLYHIDLRLRPEGDSGPPVRTLAAAEHYYSAAGQTWERLALQKARPVAGDQALGEELLEVLHTFIHPRHPPASVVSEIAGVKLRTEREVVGEGNLEADVKNGPGGIREIEFIVQALQMLHAGANPFLQTRSTREGLTRLSRYELLPEDLAERLAKAYTFLRQVEHRVQMVDERQSHRLPPPDQPLYTRIATSLGFADAAAFTAHLKEVRAGVREAYNEYLGATEREAEVQDWLHFAAGNEPSKAIAATLDRWFGPPLDNAADKIRLLILGGRHHHVTREHITLFLEISASFDRVLPPLAHPLRTLERINAFAERYGARKAFLRLASLNEHFFAALCLLFDRSAFIHEILCAHPEILEEIFFSGLRMRKERDIVRREIAALADDGDDAWARAVWLYVKAEQVRLAIAELLGRGAEIALENNLTVLADEVLRATLRRVDPDGALTLVALGKYGGSETAFGSDLDLMAVAADDADVAALTKPVQRLRKLLRYREATGPTFDVDLRLRPHGEDGPLVTTLSAFAKYHEGGSAQFWERQMLTRARVVAGHEEVGTAFLKMRDAIVYRGPLSADEITAMEQMRARVRAHKVTVEPPERAFKAGPGGLLDIEYFAQLCQLHYGHDHPALRTPHTREMLAALADEDLVARNDVEALLDHYNFLRRVELYLRRERNAGLTELSADADDKISIAKWLRFASFDAFWHEHCNHLHLSRDLLARLTREHFPPAAHHDDD